MNNRTSGIEFILKNLTSERFSHLLILKLIKKVPEMLEKSINFKMIF